VPETDEKPFDEGIEKKKEREKRLPRELKLGFVANDRI